MKLTEMMVTTTLLAMYQSLIASQLATEKRAAESFKLTEKKARPIFLLLKLSSNYTKIIYIF